MYIPFYICAAFGFVVIIAEVVALFYIHRILQAKHTPRFYRHWFQGTFLASGLLLCSVPFQIYPFNGGTMLGFPFFAVWCAVRGGPFTGDVTLPALAGDALVWFLAPHLALACCFRRWQQIPSGVPASPA